MLPDLDRLIRLQAVATLAADARKRVADAPNEIAALDARLTASRDAVSVAKQSLADAQVARRGFDNDLIAAQQRLSKYKQQLMEVKTNTEYHAMQHQIAAAAADVERVEEQILVNMLQVDDINSQLKTTEVKLKSDDAAIAKERAAIQADVADKERVLAESDREKATIIAETSRATVELFERVLSARQGIAVAQAIDGHCSICHVRLRPQVYNTILRNESIVQCDHCQRVLYFAGVHQRSAAGQAALDAAHTRQDEHERPAP